MNKLILKACLGFALFANLPCHAALVGFERHVNSLGFATNITKPGVIQDQQAGYFSGGGITMRSQVQNMNLAHLQLPSVKAGCGGIDLYNGSFSFIKGEQFESMIKSIIQASAGYALELALDSVSPQLANAMSKMRSIMNMINSQNINSCQMAASLVSGPFPKSEAARRLACQARQMGTGGIGDAVADYFTARHNCSSQDDEAFATSERGRKGDDLASLLGTEYNLVFKALHAGGITDKSLVSMLMSVSGTFIAKLEGGKQQFQFKPSLFKSNEAIAGLLKGSNGGAKGTVYECNDQEHCLNPREREINISGDGALFNKIESMIKGIVLVVKSEGRDFNLTAEQEKLISSSSIPILKIIDTELALKGGEDVSLGVSEYVEVIAYDLLVNYLEEMLDLVYRAVT